jgi:hypothetical protein
MSEHNACDRCARDLGDSAYCVHCAVPERPGIFGGGGCEGLGQLCYGAERPEGQAAAGHKCDALFEQANAIACAPEDEEPPLPPLTHAQFMLVRRAAYEYLKAAAQPAARARVEAERIVDAWEEAEGESMREGHRHTFVRLISAALSERRSE